MTRTTRLAALAALALLAIPLAVAQSGPPPGYTDPILYAQDYAKSQADQAAADPAGYAANKTTPDALGDEAEHTAWLACWTAFSQGVPLDSVCSQFFVPPGVVDAPAEAEAEVTEVLNGTDALSGELLDAVNDTLADPTTAVEQAKRIVEAVKGFVLDTVHGVWDLVRSIVDTVLDLLGLGGKASLTGLGALADGLLALLGLPALGIAAAADGLVLAATSAVDGLAAAGTGLATAMQAVADGLAAAALAFAGAASSGADGIAGGLAALGQAVTDAGSATTGAVGDAADAVVDTVADAAHAVSDTVSGWFGSDASSGASDGGLVDGDGLETGTKADGIVDRILGLL